MLFDPQNITNGGYCECEWYGKLFPPSEHAFTCSARRYEDWSRQGIKGLVETLEKKHWILRAWHQQHPTLRDWSSRAFGSGCKESGWVDETCKLGPGWTGWAGAEDDICG